MEASPFGRVAIIAPVHDGEGVAPVLEVLKANDKKKFGYDLHKVDTLEFDARKGVFRWTYSDGYYTRGKFNGGYFTTTETVTKECKCIPLQKTEDLGKTVDIFDHQEGKSRSEMMAELRAEQWQPGDLGDEEEDLY